MIVKQKQEELDDAIAQLPQDDQNEIREVNRQFFDRVKRFLSSDDRHDTLAQIIRQAMEDARDEFVFYCYYNLFTGSYEEWCECRDIGFRHALKEFERKTELWYSYTY